jgi:hypothetical protein
MSSFHFAAEQPDEQFYSDIQKINAFNEELLREFVTIILNVLQGRLELNSGIAAFCAQNKINEARLRPTVKALFYLFRGSMRNNATPRHIAEDLVQLGIEKPQVVGIAQAWKTNFTDLSRSVIGQTLQV